MNSPETTKDIQQDGKKLGQKDNQMSGTGLSQTGPRFLLLIFVVKDTFAYIDKIFLISHLAYPLIYPKMNLGERFFLFKRCLVTFLLIVHFPTQSL